MLHCSRVKVSKLPTPSTTTVRGCRRNPPKMWGARAQQNNEDKSAQIALHTGCVIDT